MFKIALLCLIVWIVGNSNTFGAALKAVQALDAKAGANIEASIR